MKELKQQVRLRRDELLMIPAFETGFFLFGEIIIWFLLRSGDEAEVYNLGSLVLAASTCFLLISMGAAMLPLCFNISISMGSTRRHMIPAYYLITFAECIAAAAYAFLLSNLEMWILQTCFDGYKITLITGPLFQIKYILPAALAIVALHTLFGSLYLKFGTPALIIFWILLISSFNIVPHVISALGRYHHTAWGRALLEFFNNITEFRLLILLYACSAVILLISWLMLRRQQVRI